ncbi:MAG: prepilin-type N-terminal cleavage/methylation domain-containing protein, partial [Desulfobacterales bacterium]|nr:prepilin-type N-terminal cleavage/methylation domain-containing protein [Desulfobacterales bacterium]
MKTMLSSKSSFSKFTNRSGFTLIEMAVVMVVVGIVISIMATVLPSLIQSAKIKKARAILEKVDYALQGYSIANHRLPFADSDANGTEDTGVFVGDLPYLTLGLSSNTDPWGNTIKYGVYGEAGGLNNLTAIFADEDAFCAAISNASTAAFTTSIV